MPLNVRCGDCILLLSPAQLRYVLDKIIAGDTQSFIEMGLISAIQIDVDVTDLSPEKAKELKAVAFGPDPTEH
jgi:hypothetical protein